MRKALPSSSPVKKTPAPENSTWRCAVMSVTYEASDEYRSPTRAMLPRSPPATFFAHLVFAGHADEFGEIFEPCWHRANLHRSVARSPTAP